MTATRTDICPPLSRIAIAIADYLIPLSEDQRDDVIARALCVVEDSTYPIPYKLTDKAQPSVRAADEYPQPTEPATPARPTPRRVSARRLEASTVIDAAANSIVAILSGHPEGLTKVALAAATNMPIAEYRFKAALDLVIHAGRIRATGVTNARRYYPAGK